MEIIIDLPERRRSLKAVLFDFDGTISTLRQGWEQIMGPFMIEMITGPVPADKELIDKVAEYIDQSTGIQTIFQMKWLAKTVKDYGRNPDAPDDPWWYKAEYNRRLMEPVERRKASIRNSDKRPSDYMILGSRELLDALAKNNIEIYAASGTDHPDVMNEIRALGLEKYFVEVAGAPLGKEDCSKEAVLRKLVSENNLSGSEVAVIGDGKVEIALGREIGAITLGVASDEIKRCGINAAKRKRLMAAGAHAIVGDYGNLDEILGWLHIQDIA